MNTDKYTQINTDISPLPVPLPVPEKKIGQGQGHGQGRNICVYLCVFICVHLWLKSNLLESQEPAIIVDQAITHFKQQKEIPGIAVGLYYKGEPLYFFYGVANKTTRQPIKENTIFAIASITKVFTSTLLALQVLEGKVRLEHPVTNYLNISKKGNLPISHVTLQELATHTSSLPRMIPQKMDNISLILSYLKRWHPKNNPGTQYLYSNFGFGLLGQILAQNENTGYYPLVREKILIPLQMYLTFLNVRPPFTENIAQGYNPKGNLVKSEVKIMFPGGGALKSTIKDMMQFLIANMGKLGPPHLREAMRFAQQPFYKVSNKLTMGLGWQRFTQNNILIMDKNGGLDGFGSYIGFIPDLDFGLVILVNKGQTNTTAIGRKILFALVNYQKRKLSTKSL